MIEWQKLLILAEEWYSLYNENLFNIHFAIPFLLDWGNLVLLLVFAIHLKIQIFLVNISSNQIVKMLMLVGVRQNFLRINQEIWKLTKLKSAIFFFLKLKTYIINIHFSFSFSVLKFYSQVSSSKHALLHRVFQR